MSNVKSTTTLSYISWNLYSEHTNRYSFSFHFITQTISFLHFQSIFVGNSLHQYCSLNRLVNELKSSNNDILHFIEISEAQHVLPNHLYFLLLLLLCTRVTITIGIFMELNHQMDSFWSCFFQIIYFDKIFSSISNASILHFKLIFLFRPTKALNMLVRTMYRQIVIVLL